MSWKPFIVTVVLTPILFGLALVQCGSGHGNCYLYVIFFPLMILPDALGVDIHPFLLAPVQLPVYGILLGIAIKKGYVKTMAICLIIFHALAVFLAFQL